MRSKPVFFLFFVFLISFSHSGLCAQSSSADSSTASVHFDTTGFPQWAKDLRRAEIVAFGSFPFAYFLANFGVDGYRSAARNWDTRYAPWPITSSGAVEKTRSEKIMTLGIAAGGAVLIALIDYGIVRYKRNRMARESRSLSAGTSIIVTPLQEKEDEVPGSATETPGSPETGSP